MMAVEIPSRTIGILPHAGTLHLSSVRKLGCNNGATVSVNSSRNMDIAALVVMT
jgi:hypothetical protein